MGCHLEPVIQADGSLCTCGSTATGHPEGKPRRPHTLGPLGAGDWGTLWPAQQSAMESTTLHSAATPGPGRRVSVVSSPTLQQGCLQGLNVALVPPPAKGPSCSIPGS